MKNNIELVAFTTISCRGKAFNIAVLNQDIMEATACKRGFVIRTYSQMCTYKFG